MAEPTTPPAPPPPPAPDASKFAGKFEGPEALETGVRELHTKLGLGDLPKALVGKDGTYTTHVALEGYYKTLEAMQGKIKPPAGASPPTAPPPPPAPLKVEQDAGDPDIAEILTKAGLKGDDLAAEWTRAGKLTEDQYTKLKGTGFPKAAVDVFMRGQQATAKLGQAEQANIQKIAAEITGGEAQTKQLLVDVAPYLSGDELEDINNRLGKLGSVKGALRDLMELRAAKSGTDGSNRLVHGAAPPAGGNTAAFSDRGEWVKARERLRRGEASDADKQRIMATPDAGPS